MRTIGFDVFRKEFRPVQNPLDSIADLDGILFGPIERECDFIRKQAAERPNCVWTLIGDTIESGFTDGGDGHVVTEVPFSGPTVVEMVCL